MVSKNITNILESTYLVSTVSPITASLVGTIRPIAASLFIPYAAFTALSNNQPDDTEANIVGTARVEIVAPGTPEAHLKFIALKGQQGIQGIKGEPGIQGVSVVGATVTEVI